MMDSVRVRVVLSIAKMLASIPCDISPPRQSKNTCRIVSWLERKPVARSASS
jgi:hypothetical protein